MKKLSLRDREVWIGKHTTLGFVLFDKENQQKVQKDRVRIYSFEKQKTNVFMKTLLRENLSKITEDEKNVLKGKISHYEKIFVNRRVTHCFVCKSDLNSIDFSICKNCKWIRCQCSACGCSYNKSYST